MPEHPDDRHILELISTEAGREKGFGLLMHQYQREVYWLIRRMVLNHEDANDLVQDTFFKVWRGLDQFRGESGLYTWVYRIAVNETLGFIRKKKLQSMLGYSAWEEGIAGALHNDAFFRGDETQHRFQKALLRLPDKQRLVFNMKYFEEMTYEEISQIVGTSVGALKASYHHAVTKLEKSMTEIKPFSK
jgi:RNA polymerase sigma-70 factor (ECF subfamily)